MTKITISRAVVEQAAEALEDMLGWQSLAPQTIQESAKGRAAALRAALAEPVQEPQGCDHCNHPLYAATKCRVCGRVTEPTPPQRKPLSEVDLRALYDRHAACQEEGPEISGWWDFARAIERAHGIGGEE